MHPHCDILVTGAAGFLGSHLCERLLELGHRVIGQDSPCPGAQHHLAQLRQHPRFRHLLPGAAQAGALRVDRIFDLAATSGPPHEPGTRGAMLELARRCGARLLQASTLRCPAPAPPGLPLRAARIFDTYGPRMQPADCRVLGHCIVQALRGEDIVLPGDGRQLHYLCYVDDAIEGLVRLMEAEAPAALELGNPQGVSLRALAEGVLQRTGSRSRLVCTAQPPDAPRPRCPDIAPARRLLEWSPRVPLALGLRRTVHDVAQRLGVALPRCPPLRAAGPTSHE